MWTEEAVQEHIVLQRAILAALEAINEKLERIAEHTAPPPSSRGKRGGK